MAHGCIERWRGRPSNRCAKLIAIFKIGVSNFKFFNSGKFSSALEILRALICGSDLAIKSISIGEIPSAAPTSRIA